MTATEERPSTTVTHPLEPLSAEEIRAFCKEHLAPYKVPTAVEFRKELPKTQVGKVLRRLLIQEELEKQKAKEPEAVA